jgi:hypothetical protein
MIILTKHDLRTRLATDGGRDVLDADIARFFGISQAAVSYWAEQDPIPERRAMQAALTRPDLFGAIGIAAANDDAAPAESNRAIDGGET